MASGLGARRKIVDVSPQMRTAINHNLRFLQQHPHNIEGHHNLAVLYLHANKDSPLLLEAAIKHLEVSLKGDAAHVPSLVDMAVALLRKKQARQAELLCRRALKCDACSAMAFNTLASALAAQDKIGKAMKNITQALYYAPRSAAVHRNAAALLRAQAQTHAAIEHYLIIVEIEPTDVNTYIHLQSALISEGRPKEAYKYAKIVNDLTGGRFRRAI
jgi:tetratricopeptide (TPR) repeat protein|tara:strand:+ start:270 stop:917 length:648 start_codon:yes stop_codon:yes gene_type:complete